jgi:Permeases of the drug/metabolite transporter (DMT) superfamily
MAYLGIWFISPRKLFADNWKDELWLLWGGVTGGSFYFFTENTALEITLATNVAFIVCTAPLLTTILSLLIYKKEKATAGLVGGSLLALVGVALVVYNGHFILKISPLGDFLTLLAAFSWAFYSLIMKKMSGRYRTTFITRKIFFYGILTILPAFILHPWQFSLSGLWQPAVWMNLLFLGVLASLVCFVVWNIILKQLGTVRASNYIYLNPLFTLIGSAVLLDEQFTVMSLMGAMLILGGVYWAGKR